MPEVQAALKKVLSELYAAGSEQRAQLIELQEMDKKAADTFAQFKEDDLGKWAAEAAEMEQRCASLAEQASAETERLRAEIGVPVHVSDTALINVVQGCAAVLEAPDFLSQPYMQQR